MDEGPTLKEGYLQRRKSESTWVKYWCTVRGAIFTYAKDKKISLKGVRIIDAGAFEGGVLGDLAREIRVHNGKRHEHVFEASSSDDFKSWLKYLKDGSAAADLIGSQKKSSTTDLKALGSAERRDSVPNAGTHLRQSDSNSSAPPSPAMSVKEGRKDSGAPTQPPAAWDHIKLLQDPEEIAAALKKLDLTGKDHAGWTPLYDAAASHNIVLCLELLKLKADPAVRVEGRNTPLHALVKASGGKEVEKFYVQCCKLMDMVIKIAGPNIVNICNSREETPLFRAVQFGNIAWVQALLERGANPRLAFVPNDRDPAHVDRYKGIYKILDSYRDAALQTEREARHKYRKGKKTTDPTLLFASGAQSQQSREATRAVPKADPEAYAMVTEPLAQSTISAVFNKFQAAAKQKDSWSMMQTVCINIDRVNLLKEESGQYYIGFGSKMNEVLQAVEATIRIVNSFNEPLAWEIAKYWPLLDTWDPATVRFEMRGQRKGVLQPLEMTEIGVSVLATKATNFLQLLVLSYHGAETPGMRKGALYFALDANMQPPAALKEFEVESARLPPLKDVLGSGASASVYKVPNFLNKGNDPFLAVKKFSYSLKGGVAEHAEDFKRFKLELFISSLAVHPNVVRTYGFVGEPPCLIMEFVQWSLRQLIDKHELAFTPAHQMRVAVGFAKGMAYLHDHSIIHRDLKPGNVLVDGDYNPKITDFGISLKTTGLSASTTKEEDLEGTLFYLAPEIFSEKVFSRESDVYAFGLCLYEIVKRVDGLTDQGLKAVGRMQFTQVRMKEPFPIKPQSMNLLEPNMRRLIEVCCSFEPSQRPSFVRCGDMLIDLRKEFLKMDVGQQLEDVQNGNVAIEVLVKEWNGRLQGIDWPAVQKFRSEFGASKGLQYLLDTLLFTPRLSNEALKEIEIFLTHYYGGAYRELAVNLRALYRACDAAASARKSTGPKAVGQPDLRDFIMREVLASLRKTSNSQPATEQDVLAWLTFVQSGENTPSLRDELGINRYLDQKRLLEERIQKLQKALESNQRQLQTLHDLPPATEYLSSFVHLQNISLPYIDNLIKKELKQLDVQLRYEDYSALFEKHPSGERNPIVERQRVLFDHFMAELHEVKVQLQAARMILAQDSADQRLAKVDKLVVEATRIAARFPRQRTAAGAP